MSDDSKGEKEEVLKYDNGEGEADVVCDVRNKRGVAKGEETR